MWTRKEGRDLRHVSEYTWCKIISESHKANRGGLGHFAVQFAKALGAHVTVLSHTPSKEQDAKKMGADDFVDTNQKEWNKPYDVRAGSFASLNIILTYG